MVATSWSRVCLLLKSTSVFIVEGRKWKTAMTMWAGFHRCSLQSTSVKRFKGVREMQIANDSQFMMWSSCLLGRAQVKFKNDRVRAQYCRIRQGHVVYMTDNGGWRGILEKKSERNVPSFSLRAQALSWAIWEAWVVIYEFENYSSD